MPLFGYKNSSIEYKTMELFSERLSSIFSIDEFISRKRFSALISLSKESYDKLSLMKKENVLQSWCRQNKCDYKKLKSYLEEYESIEDRIKSHNDSFVKNHMTIDKDYLDKVLLRDDPRIKLDDEQRSVVLSDEDYTLVIAGAGSGKTTTIEAKAKYLVDKKNIDPSRILVISFTKKATEELKQRFKKLGLNSRISTFHSIGNGIIREGEDIRYNVVDQGFMFNSIKEYLTSRIDDESFMNKILLFFASYLQIPFDSDNNSILFRQLSEDNFTTLRSDLKKVLDEYQKSQIKSRHTLNNERVRSVSEVMIANYLFINGIDYVYEPTYKYAFKNTIKPYCPDFLIKQYDKEVYLEHFGISESGKNARFSEAELETYKRHVNDKILLHREHKTKLIYTFQSYNDGRDIITHLREELIKAGISLDRKSDREIYKKIVENAEDKYFNKLIQLICNFINRFKVNNMTSSKFDEWRINLGSERTKLFIDICEKCYLVYEKALKESKSIDFEDMINKASNILNEYIDNEVKLPYDYIFIDEYQDISIQRFDLAERLSKVSDAKIVAVGDDWQSIFRFSGARIDLFTRFSETFGYADIKKITRTYRNSQELIDIAGGFVMSNDEQIKKSLKSDKHIKDPVVIMSYDDSINKNSKGGPLYRLAEAVERSLDLIGKDERKSVLLIGRYGFEWYGLLSITEFFMRGRKDGTLVSKAHPNIELQYLTAHSSKGLGFDECIVINGKDDVLGFPSKIEDDPVMKLVIKDDEKTDYSEERRLFYVALTRTRNRVYLITPQYRPSIFIREIKDKFTNVILKGEELTPIDTVSFRYKCPICGYPLQRRSNANIRFKNPLFICSNDPEICGFFTNDIKGGSMSISKCPMCEDGFLVVKPVEKEGMEKTYMLGCTNYKPDKSGCNMAINKQNYTQDLSKLTYYDKNASIEKAMFAGVSFIKLIDTILGTIATMKEGRKSFEFSPFTMAEFLCGEESKPFAIFKVNELPGYGIVNKEFKKRLYILLKELERQKYISVDKENYNHITLNVTSLKEEDYKSIYSTLS